MKKVFLTLIFTIFLGGTGFGQTPTPTATPSSGTGTGTGIGNGSGNGGNNGIGSNIPPPLPKRSDNTNAEMTALRILSKPRAVYTDLAREKETEGNVTLRVTFLASGKIGAISPVSGLPYGLTEQAIAAAKKLEFEPAKRNGVPYSITKVIQYNFVIYDNYFNENEQALTKKAEILEMPAPEISAVEDEVKGLDGKIKITVLLSTNGTASLYKPNTDWSKNLTQEIEKAVSKIKFNPAIHQNGNAVTQLKEIEYVFPE